MARGPGGGNGGGGGGFCARAKRPGHPFIGRAVEHDKHDEQDLITGATGERNHRKPGGDRGAGGRRGPRADAVARE
jgi:hypothetical protein